MSVGDRIKETREKKHMQASEVADRAGVSRQLYYRYENNLVTNIPSDKLEEIAKALHVSPGFLMGWELDRKEVLSQLKPLIIQPSEHYKTIPVLGHVAAGLPISAQEEILEYIQIPEELAAEYECFALRVEGTSMEPRVKNGDTAIVRHQSTAESGQVVIALINGEATCKELHILNEGIALVPWNKSYPKLFYTKQDVEDGEVKIIGRVIEFRSRV